MNHSFELMDAQVMEPTYLHLATIIGSPDAVSSEDGERVFYSINEALKSGRKVNLDFGGITLLITSFLNTAVGQLYGVYDTKFIQDHLSVSNLSDEDKDTLRLVTRRAKEYFQNRKAMDEEISKILGDDQEH